MKRYEIIVVDKINNRNKSVMQFDKLVFDGEEREAEIDEVVSMVSECCSQ